MTKGAALPCLDDRKDKEANIKEAENKVRAAASFGAQVVNSSDCCVALLKFDQMDCTFLILHLLILEGDTPS